MAASALAQPFSPNDWIAQATLTQGPDLTTGLVAYWKFDEATNTFNNAADSSGTGNGLTYYPLSSGGQFRTDGHLNNCWSNANSGNGGFTNSARLRVPAYTNVGGFSYSWWMRAGPSVAATYIYTEASTASASNPHFRIYPSSGIIAVDITADNGSSVVNYTSAASPFPNGVWTHIVYTFDNTQGATGTGRLYINGVLDTKSPFTYSTSVSVTLQVATVGAIWNTGTMASVSNVSFDEFRIYNLVLTPAQVTALFHL